MNNGQWIVDDGLALVLKVSRMFGTAPVRFQKQSEKIVKFSRPYFIFGILLGLIIGVYYVTEVQRVLYASEDVPRHKYNETASYVSLPENNNMFQSFKFMLLIFFTIFTTLSSKNRLEKLFHCHSRISQIKKEIFYKGIKQSSGFNKWQIGLILFGLETYSSALVFFNPELNTSGTYIELYLIIASMSIRITTIIQFVVVAQYVNSAFGNINNSLEAIMCDLSEPFSNEHARNPKFCLESINCDLYIPISNINRAIDLIGNVEEMYPNINTRLAKFATIVNQLCSAYEKVADVVRNMNNIESTNFVFYIIHFISYLPWITLRCIVLLKSDEVVNKRISIPAPWIIYVILEILLVFEVCHHTRQMVARTRFLLGKVMTMSSKSPLMADAADAFFSRLILSDVSYYSIFNMCHLDRTIYYSISGCSATLIVLFMCLFK